MTSAERRDKFITDEYAAHGLKPYRASDGTLVSLRLARKLGAPLEPIEQQQAAE